MRHFAPLIALVAAAPVLAAGALQDENPSLTDLGKTLTHYATIARNDGSFRRFWVDEPALKGMSAEALPDGTMIAMETFYGPQKPATVFIKQRQDGKWLYGSFEPGQPDWSGMKGKTVCHACHMDAKADLTFTLPTLASFAASRLPLRLECPLPGREPCEDALYHGVPTP